MESKRGGRGKGYHQSREVTVSKILSYILRHGAVELGLNIGSDGFIDLDEVLMAKSIKSK